MRQQSRIQVMVRDIVIGGGDPLVCLPLLAKGEDMLVSHAHQVKESGADLLEWRVDCFEQVGNKDACSGCLKALRKEIGSLPLIFTFRSLLEGGQSDINEEKRLELIKDAQLTGNADIVDIEMSSQSDFITSIKEIREQTQSKLILSYHNFEETPSEEFIVDKLVQAEEMGADIAKVAVMPKSTADVLTLLSATNHARTTFVKIPMITMSMGPIGAITRLAGGLFGSDITFAMWRDSSAPGQLPIGDVRRVMDILY